VPLFINLIQISKYDAIFEVKRIKYKSILANGDITCLIGIDIPMVLHNLIQIAFDEQSY
jgi:hypothetical protein